MAIIKGIVKLRSWDTYSKLNKGKYIHLELLVVKYWLWKLALELLKEKGNKRQLIQEIKVNEGKVKGK